MNPDASYGGLLSSALRKPVIRGANRSSYDAEDLSNDW